MFHDKLPIRASNAGRLIALVKPLPHDCTHVDVDDALFAVQVVPPLSAPLGKAPIGDDAQPVLPLAARLHAILGAKRYADRVKRTKAERAKRHMSERRYQHELAMAPSNGIMRASVGPTGSPWPSCSATLRPCCRCSTRQTTATRRPSVPCARSSASCSLVCRLPRAGVASLRCVASLRPSSSTGSNRPRRAIGAPPGAGCRGGAQSRRGLALEPEWQVAEWPRVRGSVHR